MLIPARNSLAFDGLEIDSPNRKAYVGFSTAGAGAAATVFIAVGSSRSHIVPIRSPTPRTRATAVHIIAFIANTSRVYRSANRRTDMGMTPEMAVATHAPVRRSGIATAA